MVEDLARTHLNAWRVLILLSQIPQHYFCFNAAHFGPDQEWKIGCGKTFIFLYMGLNSAAIFLDMGITLIAFHLAWINVQTE